MTTQEIKKLQKELENLYDTLSTDIGGSAMDMVNEIVNLELQLEAECGQ